MNQEGTLIWGIVGVLMLLALCSSAWAGGRKGRQGGMQVQQTVAVHTESGVSLPAGWGKGKKTGWAGSAALLPPGQEKNLLAKGKVPKKLQP